MVCATCMVGLAFWMGQITVASEIAAKNKILPPPTKTRHAIRTAPATFTGDPAADYIARCEKGMTDQEIGWIVEDFQNAGLADPIQENATPAQLLAYRAIQQRWYHDALVDALRLNHEQSIQVTTKLAELLDSAKVNLIEAINAQPKNWQVNDTGQPNERSKNGMDNLITASLWLFDKDAEFMPWNLCKLTTTQETITWKRWVDDQKKNGSRRVSAEEIDSILKNSLDDPLMSDWNRLPSAAPLPDGSPLVDGILPFPRPLKGRPTPNSKPDESRKLPGRFQTLHPAQFMLDLLFNPDYATAIQRAINGATPLENATNPFAE
jgi:hypothetical protein